MIDVVQRLNGDLNQMNNANNFALKKLMSGNVTSQDLDKFSDLSDTITGSLDKLMGPLAKAEKAIIGGIFNFLFGGSVVVALRTHSHAQIVLHQLLFTLMAVYTFRVVKLPLKACALMSVRFDERAL